MLPSGVAVLPTSLSLAPGVPGIFTFSASSGAEFLQQQVGVNATSGTLSEKTGD
jgi:hypothetical protein